MTAKFKPGDLVRRIGSDEQWVVKFCGDVWFLAEDNEGDEHFAAALNYELAPPPLPESYIGYTHGGNQPEGVPTVYPLSIFHGSDTFYGHDVYEVEVRYIRKLDTSRDKAS